MATENSVTENTRDRLREAVSDMIKDCEDDFTGAYKLEFNEGGLTCVKKIKKKQWIKEK